MKVLSPNYNTFVYNPSSRSHWFANNASENSSDLFLVGVVSFNKHVVSYLIVALLKRHNQQFSVLKWRFSSCCQDRARFDYKLSILTFRLGLFVAWKLKVSFESNFAISIFSLTSLFWYQLMGLAVYNCITLDISLPMVCYRKLLSTVPRTPPTINHPADTLQTPSTNPSTSQAPAKKPSTHQTSPSSSCQLIGVVSVSLSDLISLDPVRF